MDIEKVLFPEKDKLVEIDEVQKALIVDAELDAIECTFNGDDCVELNTNRYTYITLTKENLQTLIDLIEEVDDKIE